MVKVYVVKEITGRVLGIFAEEDSAQDYRDQVNEKSCVTSASAYEYELRYGQGCYPDGSLARHRELR